MATSGDPQMTARQLRLRIPSNGHNLSYRKYQYDLTAAHREPESADPALFPCLFGRLVWRGRRFVGDLAFDLADALIAVAEEHARVA